MSQRVSISEGIVSLPGAGRRTLLAVLPAELSCLQVRLCILDASRLDDPAQSALLRTLAQTPSPQTLFVLNKADLADTPSELVRHGLRLLEEAGFQSPELYLTCAEAARLFRRAQADFSAEERAALARYYDRFGADRAALSTCALTQEPPLHLGDLRLNREQLRLALIHTGVPLLESRLRQLAGQESPSDAAKMWAGSEQTELAAQGAQSSATRQGQDFVCAPVPAPEGADTTDGAPVFDPKGADATDGAPVFDPEEAAAMALLRELLERADCAELLESARAVSAGTLLSDIREQALDALHKAYLERTQAELEALVADAERLPLSELLHLRERINSGPYPVQTRTPYAERITTRIEQLQTQQLKTICEGLETAELPELEAIAGRLSEAPCAEALKTDFFHRIRERKNALDREALERIVEGAETKSLQELQAISVTLQANNWNPDYVPAYRHKIDLLQQAARFREVQEHLVNLNDMDRREVIALKERIAGLSLPPRFTIAAMAQIDLRLYRMDLLRLLALNNDFDSLSFEGLDNLRAQVGRSDTCALARQTYLNRLLNRETALVIETAAARAALARQLANQNRLRMADFVFAAPSQEFERKVAAFWGGSGKEQPRDYPAFLLNNGSEFAFTGTRFYFKTDQGLEFLPLEEIQRFQYMKQKLSLNLQIVRKDDTYLLTEAKIGRNGAERTLDFLNACLLRWNEPGVEQTRSAAPLRTARFERACFTQPVEPMYPTSEMALSILQDALRKCKRSEGLVQEDAESLQKLRRILQTFELAEQTPIVWYSVSSILGSVKEGTLVGSEAIYSKQSKQPTRSIPLESIEQLRRTGGKQVELTTVQGQHVTLHIPGDLAEPLWDYICAIQLGRFLARAEEAGR